MFIFLSVSFERFLRLHSMKISETYLKNYSYKNIQSSTQNEFLEAYLKSLIVQLKETLNKQQHLFLLQFHYE